MCLYYIFFVRPIIIIFYFFRLALSHVVNDDELAAVTSPASFSFEWNIFLNTKLDLVFGKINC